MFDEALSHILTEFEWKSKNRTDKISKLKKIFVLHYVVIRIYIQLKYKSDLMHNWCINDARFIYYSWLNAKFANDNVVLTNLCIYRSDTYFRIKFLREFIKSINWKLQFLKIINFCLLNYSQNLFLDWKYWF